MRWGYSFDGRALRELKKLGTQAQREILKYLGERVATENVAKLGDGYRIQ